MQLLHTFSNTSSPATTQTSSFRYCGRSRRRCLAFIPLLHIAKNLSDTLRRLFGVGSKGESSGGVAMR